MMPIMKNIAVETQAQNALFQNISQPPQYEYSTQELIYINKPSEESMTFALTRCDLSRVHEFSLHSNQPAPIPVSNHFMTGFCSGGYGYSGEPQMCFALYNGPQIIIWNEINYPDMKICLRDAQLYRRKLLSRRHNSYDSWVDCAKPIDFELVLEHSIVALGAACRHWNDLYYYDERNKLRFKNASLKESLGFTKISRSTYGRNWSGVDGGDAFLNTPSVRSITQMI